MEAVSIKEAVKLLVDQLPDNATWDDLMHEIYVRQSIEGGLADSRAGRTTSVEAVCEQLSDPIFQLGLDPVIVDVTDASLNHDRYLYQQQ